MRGFCSQTTLMGKVTEILEDAEHKTQLKTKGIDFKILCHSGDEFYISVADTTSFQPIYNLDNINRDRYANPPHFSASPEDQIRKYLSLNRLVVVEGVFFQNALERRVDARTVHLLYDLDNQQVTESEGKFLFEQTHWWLTQISRLADVWLDAIFEGSYRKFDFTEYRTNLDITFAPASSNIQEMATLSRLIYGFSSAYLLTGSQRFLDAAKEGVNYQREYFRSLSHDGQYCFWAYGKDGNKLIIPSESDENLGRGSIPLYEQIYALAGITQYYRITLEWEALDDIRRTVNTFMTFFYDDPQKGGQGGFFSHLDPSTLKPKQWPVDEELVEEYDSPQQPRKNWNSIGDHIPAYLINLILALEPLPKGENTEDICKFLDICHQILAETSGLIVDKFPEENNPFVNERFYTDWRPDKKWDWQQDRAIVGHNLKIAWNLTRVANYYKQKDKLDDAERQKGLAETLAQNMVQVGAVDLFRGGCFDALERKPKNGMPREYPWLNTKDFWQQEQGILAYLILYGQTKNPEYLELAREMMAFWNIFFLDRDRGGVYFRVTDNGSPVIQGGYGQKGNQAISGYHIFELCFLAHLYLMTYVSSKPFCLFFKPEPHINQTTLNVLPDFFPPNSLEIKRITVNGVDRSTVDQDNFQIELKPDEIGAEIVVEFKPLVGEKGEEETALPEMKGKIGILVESHFDETEIVKFSEFFPQHGYDLVYISRLWQQPMLEFTGNEHLDSLRVRTDVESVDPSDFKGFIFVGGYAMDRLRYEPTPEKNQENQAPAVNFARKISQISNLKIGTICHSLWLFTAAPELLKGKKVTCAHNLIYDVQNAGAEVIFKAEGETVDTYVDGDFITGKHPGVVDAFMRVYLEELEKVS